VGDRPIRLLFLPFGFGPFSFGLFGGSFAFGGGRFGLCFGYPSFLTRRSCPGGGRFSAGNRGFTIGSCPDLGGFLLAEATAFDLFGSSGLKSLLRLSGFSEFLGDQYRAPGRGIGPPGVHHAGRFVDRVVNMFGVTHSSRSVNIMCNGPPGAPHAGVITPTVGRDIKAGARMV